MLFRRIGAYGVDYLVILVWMAGLALAAQAGWIGIGIADDYSRAARWAAQAQAFLMLTLPVLLYFIILESVGRKATFGKSITRIEVTGSRHQVVVRNLLKFAPWEIAHTAIWHGMPIPFASEPTALGLALFGLSLSLAGLYLVTLFIGEKTVLYDRLAGTNVVRAGLKHS